MDMDISSSKMPLAYGCYGFAMAHAVQQGRSELTQVTGKHLEDEPFVRNLIISALDVFILAQKQYQSNFPDPVPQSALTRLSQMYRGLILELCQNLKGTGDHVGADLYANLDFVWHFCEIMFLSSHPELPILPYLMDWVKINFDMTAEILPGILNGLPDLEPQAVQSLWNLIFSHVFHGSTSEAAIILPYVSGQAPGNSMDRKFDLMQELLANKPQYNPREGSVTEFESLWQAWQDECRNRLRSRIFFGHDQLNFICKILCGEEEAFREASEKGLLTWYEYLVMTLNYRFPTTQPASLKAYAKSTLEDLDMIGKQESRDVILLHAMEFDIVNVLKEIQNVWDTPWLALHFSDLVYAGGKFPSVGDVRIDYSSVTPLRNYFLLDYGSSLIENPTLWQLGVQYLEALPDNVGKCVISECIQRRDPSSELEAQKLLQIAAKYNLETEMQGICRKVALESIKTGRLQNALLWSTKAGDGPLTTHIVDKILFDGDCHIEHSLLDSLTNSIPCSDRLLFLSGYAEFQKFLDQKLYKVAVSELCSLIRSDLIPKRLSHKIILRLLALETEDVTLEPNETSTLMEFLHTKVGPERMTEEEFTKLNSIFMCSRAREILNMFKFQKQIAGY